jgi:hypothetical protein
MEPVTMELPEHQDPSPDPEDTVDAAHIDFTVLETYLPTVFTADEQQRSDVEGPDSTRSGTSRGHVEVVPFPGHAGASVGVGISPFANFNSSTTNSSPSHTHLLDPELWELVRWLMNSGLTAGARGNFFKLKKVSNLRLRLAAMNLRPPYSAAPGDLAVEL